jgi:hypothetical protein
LFDRRNLPGSLVASYGSAQIERLREDAPTLASVPRKLARIGYSGNAGRERRNTCADRAAAIL